MWTDRISNPGPLTYESDALPIALRGPANLGLKYGLISVLLIRKVNRNKMAIPPKALSIKLIKPAANPSLL